MAFEEISFQTSDAITLRGWFIPSTCTATSPNPHLPCLVLSHGLTALKEMDLGLFASHFAAALPLHCLVFDQRGFGTSDAAPGQPRGEIIPAVQIGDLRDAVTYAQARPDVDAGRVGLWGSSYSGGHVLWAGAVDRRVRAVLSQVPMVDGWENARRLMRADLLPGIERAFQDDRLARAAGKPPAMVPVVDKDPLAPSALPSPDSYAFFSAWAEKSKWKNELTLRSLECLKEYVPIAHIAHISPTPLLLTVAEHDVVTPTDLALGAYAQAREPKQLQILPGGHFDAYSGPNFERNVHVQTEFLRKYLVKEDAIGA